MRAFISEQSPAKDGVESAEFLGRPIVDFSLYGFDDRIDGNLKAIGWHSSTLAQHDILRRMKKNEDLYAVAERGEGKLSAAVLGLAAKFARSEKPKAKLVGAVVLPGDDARRKSALAIAKAVSRGLDIEIADLGACEVKQLPSFRAVILLGTVGDFAKAPLGGRSFDTVIFDRYPESLANDDEAARKFKLLHAKDVDRPQTLFLAEAFDESEYADAREYSQKLKRSSTYRNVGDPDIREEFVFANAREIFPTLMKACKRKDLGILSGRTLVLASSRYRADRACGEMADLGVPIARLQASGPSVREEILNCFDEGRSNIVCCAFGEFEQVLDRTFDTVIFIGPAKSAVDYQNALSVVLKNDEDFLATGPGRALTFVSTREFGAFLKLEADLGRPLRLSVASKPSVYEIPEEKIAAPERLKNCEAVFKANASARIKAHKEALKLDKRIDKKLAGSRSRQAKPSTPHVEAPLPLSGSGGPNIVVVAGVEVAARDADAFARSLIYGPEALKTSGMAFAKAQDRDREPQAAPIFDEVPAHAYGSIIHFPPLGERAEQGNSQLILSEARLRSVMSAMEHADQSSAAESEAIFAEEGREAEEAADESAEAAASDEADLDEEAVEEDGDFEDDGDELDDESEASEEEDPTDFEDADDASEEFEQEAEAAPARRTLTIRSGYVPKKHIEQEITKTEPLSSSGAALRAAQAAERRAVGKTGEALTHQLIGRKGRKNIRAKEAKRRKDDILYSNALPGMGGLNLEKPSAKKEPAKKNGGKLLAKKSKQKFKNQQRRQREPGREMPLEEASTASLAGGAPTDEEGAAVQTPRKNKPKNKTGLKQKRMPVLSKAALADMTPESLAKMADEVMGGRFGGEAPGTKMRPKRLRVRTPRSMRLKHQRSAQQGTGRTVGDEAGASASSTVPVDVLAARTPEKAASQASQGASSEGAAAAQKPQMKKRDGKKRFLQKKARQQRRGGGENRFAADEDNFGNSVHYRPRMGMRKIDFLQPASVWAMPDPFARSATALTFSQSMPAQGDGYRSLFGESLTAPMAAPGMRESGKEKRRPNGNTSRKNAQTRKGPRKFKPKKLKTPKPVEE